MATRILARRIKIILITMFFLSITSLLNAQDISVNAERRLVQRLSWTGGEYDFNYEIIIEIEESGSYRRILQGFTTMTYFDVALSPGFYRFLVIPYDIIDLPGQQSEWSYIEVRSVPVTIADTPPEPEREPPKPKPESIRTTDFLISAVYMPLLPIYGKALDEGVIFAGASGSMGIFGKEGTVNFGFDLTASWYRLEKNIFGVSVQDILTAELNFGVRLKMPNEALSLNIRFGAGLLFLLNTEKYISLPDQLYTNIGVSFRWLILKNLFLEAGLDHIHFFVKPYTGALRPRIGIGWQF